MLKIIIVFIIFCCLLLTVSYLIGKRINEKFKKRDWNKSMDSDDEFLNT